MLLTNTIARASTEPSVACRMSTEVGAPHQEGLVLGQIRVDHVRGGSGQEHQHGGEPHDVLRPVAPHGQEAPPRSERLPDPPVHAAADGGGQLGRAQRHRHQVGDHGDGVEEDRGPAERGRGGQIADAVHGRDQHQGQADHPQSASAAGARRVGRRCHGPSRAAVRVAAERHGPEPASPATTARITAKLRPRPFSPRAAIQLIVSMITKSVRPFGASGSLVRRLRAGQPDHRRRAARRQPAVSHALPGPRGQAASGRSISCRRPRRPGAARQTPSVTLALHWARAKTRTGYALLQVVMLVLTWLPAERGGGVCQTGRYHSTFSSAGWSSSRG